MPKPNFFPIIPPISPADARWVKNDDVRAVRGRQGQWGNTGAAGGLPDREGKGWQ
jgi:hypothetical protein